MRYHPAWVKPLHLAQDHNIVGLWRESSSIKLIRPFETYLIFNLKLPAPVFPSKPHQSLPLQRFPRQFSISWFQISLLPVYSLLRTRMEDFLWSTTVVCLCLFSPECHMSWSWSSCAWGEKGSPVPPHWGDIVFFSRFRSSSFSVLNILEPPCSE